MKGQQASRSLNARDGVVLGAIVGVAYLVMASVVASVAPALDHVIVKAIFAGVVGGAASVWLGKRRATKE